MLELIALLDSASADWRCWLWSRRVPVFKWFYLRVFSFRLLFKLLWIPVGLVGGAFSLVAGAAILPVLLIVGVAVVVIGAIAAVLALLVPAIPFILLGLAVWAVMRTRPATA